MTDYLPVINIILNSLIIPLLWILMGIKSELAKLNAIIEAHESRIERIERLQDR